LEMTQLELEVESERGFLQSVFDTIPDLLVVLDKEKKITRVNTSFSSFVHKSGKEALGMTCGDVFAETEFNRQWRETTPVLDEVFSLQKPRTAVWRTDPPHEIYWEVTRTPIINPDGEMEAVLCIWHRITERVMLRREIESAEQRFRGFIDSAHDWISIKDLEGRYVIVNPAIARAFHRKPEDFVGKRAVDMLPAGLAKTVMLHDQEVISTNSHHTYDEIIPIDERDYYFQTVRFPLTDYKGSTIGVCTIARDVTSEKDLRTQLVQAEKLAAVGKLAAGVAHEINNPLTGILAYAEDLTDELPEDDSHQKDLKVIIREALRCRDIVRNLLDFARHEEPELKKVDPNTIIDQSLVLVERLPQFRNITIEKNMAEDIPHVKCDLRHMQQVLLNLMLNAADAMKGKGKIILTTEHYRRRNRCVISVEDNGPGIPQNLMDKLFEPFFSTKGTSGLGLAVSWGIIERHGGVIEVDMAENGGSIFRIVLPAMTEEEKPQG
ncbi:MAG: PAS domain-containing protein, partial [candidate division Zixibacteria bacterium]|nr:PAS domain-containing protein [candidate division Zixibacteria bacterium]